MVLPAPSHMQYAGWVEPRTEPRRLMTINITLTPEQERTLQDLARRSGKDPAAYVQKVVAAHLSRARHQPVKTLEKILTPIWEGWRHSGMTEDEIDEFFDQELQEVRRERRQQKASS